MQISRIKKVLGDQSLWENLEVIITGSGATIYTNRIEGFVRKLSYLPHEQYKLSGNNGLYFYFTNNDNSDPKSPVPEPSLGTLKIIEEDNVISYTDRITGYDVEIDIDQIQQLVYTKDKGDNIYPGNPTFM